MLNKRPNATGARTTCRVDRIKSDDWILTYDPASLVVSHGVINTAATVEQAVITTERATSACAMSVTRFDAVPPGAHPTRIRPALNAGPSCAIYTHVYRYVG